MKKILIPVDFSENSKKAITYAGELFKNEQAAFYLMHAYADKVYSTSKDEVSIETSFNKIKDSVEDNLNKLLRTTEINALKHHNYSTLSSFNSLIDETEKIVRDKDIDLVVMGTKGLGKSQKLTFGSNTIQVLRFIEAPVLSVPDITNLKQPGKILFITDFSKDFKRRELELICELAHQFQSKVELVLVSKNKNLSPLQQRHKSLIDDVLGKIRLSFIIIENDNVVDALVQYIKNDAIDLIVVANTKHTSLDKFVLPSVINGISAQVNIPMLVLQNIRK